jgi:hypothetical protein
MHVRFHRIFHVLPLSACKTLPPFCRCGVCRPAVRPLTSRHREAATGKGQTNKPTHKEAQMEFTLFASIPPPKPFISPCFAFLPAACGWQRRTAQARSHSDPERYHCALRRTAHPIDGRYGVDACLLACVGLYLK